jgi:hypothetical protein
MTPFKLVIAEPHRDVGDVLRRELEGAAHVEVVDAPLSLVGALSRIDAYHVSVPMGERWGARPEGHEAQVLPTTDEDRDRGLPPYVIAGATFDGEELSYESRLLIALDAVYRAATGFDATGTRIRRVAFLSEHLLVDELGPRVAGATLRFWSEALLVEDAADRPDLISALREFARRAPVRGPEEREQRHR